MKILFGVQGTGNGHISRSRELVRRLREDGHDVQVVISGRREEELQEIEVFQPYRVLKGLTLITHRGRMNYIETMFRLDFLTLTADVLSLDTAGVDLVVTDFEPVTSLAARMKGLPSVGFGHQYAFPYHIPVARGNLFEKYTLLNFAPARYNAGLHWHHFDQPIFPPVIPESLYRTSRPPEHPKKILVYLPFEELEDVDTFVQPFTDHDFYIYGKVKESFDFENHHFRSYSREGFLQDLLECSGVVCNAGFELPGEALHLGKKLLLRPLDGQIEQESNALAMVELGYGMAMHRLDHDVMDHWLGQPGIPPRNYRRTVDYITEWIGSGRWDDLRTFTEAAWKDDVSESVETVAPASTERLSGE
jgi:uncharacterized protein (TIGR00661 family)